MAFELVLTPAWLQSSWQDFENMVYHRFLSRAERGWLAQNHPAGFVTKVGLEFTVPWFVA